MNDNENDNVTPQPAPVAGEDDKAVEEKKQRRKYKKRIPNIKHTYPVEPRLIQQCEKSRELTDHTYRDFSIVPPTQDYKGFPEKIEEMDFNQKMHHLLAEADPKIVSWLPHGRAFKIHVPALFEKQYCQKYYGHARYSSFLRQLNNQGYKHITKGPDRNAYYHECMLRGMPHLTKYMPFSRDARRTAACPDKEPNFYVISNIYPLPDQRQSQSKPVNTAAQLNLGLPVMSGLNPGLYNPLFAPPSLSGTDLGSTLLARQAAFLQGQHGLLGAPILPIHSPQQSQEGLFKQFKKPDEEGAF